MKQEHKFPIKWTLKDADFTKDKGKVFSCFSCGGGSTMGYKLAGYDVIGNLEFDEKKNETYNKNHHPKYSYCEDIRDFRKRGDLPDELYALDILDGSPPCKSFSMAGSREETWGKEVEKYGHTQVWDDLFFEFIALAKKLQPKVVVAENVKGLLLGNAKKYVQRIYEAFEDAGYVCMHNLFDASTMGVPQKRERVIFTCFRRDLAKDFMQNDSLFAEFCTPKIDFYFNEKPILYKEYADYQGEAVKSPVMARLIENRREGDKILGDALYRLEQRESFYSQTYIHDDSVSATLTAHRDCLFSFKSGTYLSKSETCSIATFPQDYDFCESQFWELCGRAVPPVMMAQISSRIYEHWLSKL